MLSFASLTWPTAGSPDADALGSTGQSLKLRDVLTVSETGVKPLWIGRVFAHPVHRRRVRP